MAQHTATTLGPRRSRTAVNRVLRPNPHMFCDVQTRAPLPSFREAHVHGYLAHELATAEVPGRLTISGEIDIATVAKLDAAIAARIEGITTLDLSAVTFCDVAGWRALTRWICDPAHDVRVISSEAVDRIFTACGDDPPGVSSSPTLAPDGAAPSDDGARRSRGAPDPHRQADGRRGGADGDGRRGGADGDGRRPRGSATSPIRRRAHRPRPGSRAEAGPRRGSGQPCRTRRTRLILSPPVRALDAPGVAAATTTDGRPVRGGRRRVRLRARAGRSGTCRSRSA